MTRSAVLLRLSWAIGVRSSKDGYDARSLEIVRQYSPVQSDRNHGGTTLARVIEFYIPTTFRRPLKSAVLGLGKVIEFCTQTRKSA